MNKSYDDTNMSIEQKNYIRKINLHQKKIRVIQLLLLVLFLLTWELGTQLKLINSFVFSSPFRIVKCLIEMTSSGELFRHVFITLFETLLSFSLVIGLGLLFAIILWWNKSISEVLEPYLIVLNSLPKSALAPVFIVWLGNNMKTIVVAAISVALFGCIITLYTSFTEVDEDKIKLIKTLGGSRRDVLFKVILPANIPSLISVMKVNIGLSLVGVIIGEFLAAKAGLGYLIVYGSQVFKLDWVMLSIVILCIVATFLYKALAFVEKKYKRN